VHNGHGIGVWVVPPRVCTNFARVWPAEIERRARVGELAKKKSRESPRELHARDMCVGSGDARDYKFFFVCIFFIFIPLMDFLVRSLVQRWGKNCL
jgi:hypothetical protein